MIASPAASMRLTAGATAGASKTGDFFTGAGLVVVAILVLAVLVVVGAVVLRRLRR